MESKTKNKDLKAIGEMVVIKFTEVPRNNKVTKNGIELIGTADEKPVFEAFIDSVGGSVPDDCGFKVGDSVVFNDHDIKMFDVENPEDIMKPTPKGICHMRSIWAVYESK